MSLPIFSTAQQESRNSRGGENAESGEERAMAAESVQRTNFFETEKPDVQLARYSFCPLKQRSTHDVLGRELGGRGDNGGGSGHGVETLFRGRVRTRGKAGERARDAEKKGESLKCEVGENDGGELRVKRKKKEATSDVPQQMKKVSRFSFFFLQPSFPLFSYSLSDR